MNLLRLVRNGSVGFEERGAGLFGIKEAKEPRRWLRPASDLGMGALYTATIHWTDVYLFASDGRPAVHVLGPFAMRLAVSGVISVSVSLGALSEFLGEIQLGKSGEIFIIDERAQVVVWTFMRRCQMGTESLCCQRLRKLGVLRSVLWGDRLISMSIS